MFSAPRSKAVGLEKMEMFILKNNELLKSILTKQKGEEISMLPGESQSHLDRSLSDSFHRMGWAFSPGDFP